MASKLTLTEAVEHRRSIYQLTNKSTISDDRLKQIFDQIVLTTPSCFNSQSTRLVVLLREQHERFWDVVRDILKTKTPAEKWESTAGRMEGFRNAYGTILFYEDPSVLEDLKGKFSQYADKFPEWADATNGMHQYHAWTALEAEGFGANLQHYNPLPDEKAAEIWNIPSEWQLKAQLVFGGVAEGARDSLRKKDQKPLSSRLFVHGAQL